MAGSQVPMSEYPNLLIAIGASAGGLQEIFKIIDQTPDDFSASIIVATHRSATEENMLAEVLANNTRLTVVSAVDGDTLSCAHLYVGRGQDMITVEGRNIDIDIDINNYRRLERINDLFKSVAETAGKNSVGVILSGMLSDGVDGLEAIKAVGGFCCVQHPDDAEFDSMPLKAIARVDCDFIGTAREIGLRLVELAAGRSCE